MAAHDPAADPRERGMGELVKELAGQTSTLVRQEIKLAQAEVTQKGTIPCASPILNIQASSRHPAPAPTPPGGRGSGRGAHRPAAHPDRPGTRDATHPRTRSSKRSATEHRAAPSPSADASRPDPGTPGADPGARKATPRSRRSRPKPSSRQPWGP